MNSSATAVPVQCAALTHWPDGSVRMAHLTFAGPAGLYDAKLPGAAAEDRHTEQATETVPGVRLTEAGGRVTVSNGRLQALLGGRGLVHGISLDGRAVLGDGAIEIQVVRGDGTAFRASIADEVTTEIETEGPLRSVIALRGRCAGPGGDGFLQFRLRFEFLAGVEGFTLSYSFFNCERGADFHEVRSITLSLALSRPGSESGPEPELLPQHSLYQSQHGIYQQSGRLITTPDRLHIVVDDSTFQPRIENAEALRDDTPYPFYLNPPLDRVAGWGAVSLGENSVWAEMDDFHILRPKTLEMEGGELRFGIWPERAGMLTLQQGRSREVTLRVMVSDNGPPASAAAAASAFSVLRDQFRAQLAPEEYAAARFFDQHRCLPFDPARNTRMEQWLGGLAAQLQTVATFFDLGDTPDSHYQSGYISVGRAKRVRGDDGVGRLYSAGGQALPQNTLEDFETVWVNNEYDIIFSLGTEYLRSGNLGLWQKLCWFARHTIEVDFLHYSDHQWLHRAQPAHSVRHTTTGAYPSHFWTQGLAQYYMLSGDPDALEVIVALADKTIENLEHPVIGGMTSGLNREIGWGILSLVCAYEASGDKRFDVHARTLLEKEMAVGLPADIPIFGFGYTSILLGARQYLQVHEDDAQDLAGTAAVRRWFLEFVDLAIACSREAPKSTTGGESKGYSYDNEWKQRGQWYSERGRTGIFTPRAMAHDAFAYAYEITGDERYIRAGLKSLESMIDSPGTLGDLDTGVFRNPPREGKVYAMLTRTWLNYFKCLDDLGWLKQFGYNER